MLDKPVHDVRIPLKEIKQFMYKKNPHMMVQLHFLSDIKNIWAMFGQFTFYNTTQGHQPTWEDENDWWMNFGKSMFAGTQYKLLHIPELSTP